MQPKRSPTRHSARKPARYSPRNASTKGTGGIVTGFTGFYPNHPGQLTKTDTNGRRLKAVIKMFSLSPSAVARQANVSPAYISRVLSETDPLVGSSAFYIRLEAALGKLIDQRQQQFFRVAPVNVRSVERAAQDAMELAA